VVDYCCNFADNTLNIMSGEDFSLCVKISNLLDEIMDDSQSSSVSSLNMFTMGKAPSISIKKYIKRIVKNTGIEDSTLILSLIYIDRVCKKTGFELNRLNLHRLLLTSVLISMKFNEDNAFSNAYYAKIVGITLRELNCLESKFLEMINYSLTVKPKEYQEYEESITE
jgi:hypothetical protein